MKSICTGWFEPKHDPVYMGDKEPLSDPRISHGICPECEDKFLAMEEKEEARWA